MIQQSPELSLPRKRRESPLNVGMKRRKNNLHFIPSFFII